MGLITKEVTFKLNFKVAKYYINLGYATKANEIITVKVEDLTSGSNHKVEDECDCCGKHYEIPYGQYTRCNNNGKKRKLQINTNNGSIAYDNFSKFF